MTKHEQWLDEQKRVRAFVASNPEGTHVEGKVVGYCDAPMVLIESDDGSKTYWRSDMCAEVEEKSTQNQNARMALWGARDTLSSLLENRAVPESWREIVKDARNRCADALDEMTDEVG